MVELVQAGVNEVFGEVGFRVIFRKTVAVDDFRTVSEDCRVVGKVTR